MEYKMLIPVLVSFIICVILCPVMIPFLKKLKFGQQVRDDGPQSHLKKSGTPTMGGVIILITIVVVSLFYLGEYPEILPVLFCTLGFGIIGFLDDYLKIVMKRSEGLTPLQKLLGQIIITSILGYYLVNYTNVGTSMLIPFTGGFESGVFLDTSYLFVPILFFITLGTVNGVNFTDGLDGLATSITLLVATFFAVVAIGVKSGVAPVTCIVAGALLGFLVYNIYPAKVFMGDTGSLALGGFVVSVAYMLRIPLFIPIVGFIYFIEVVSVIIQVIYFKLTKGKRFFKMAPIHHHFELSGWPETKVAAIFSIITTVLCIIGLIGL